MNYKIIRHIILKCFIVSFTILSIAIFMYVIFLLINDFYVKVIGLAFTMLMLIIITLIKLGAIKLKQDLPISSIKNLILITKSNEREKEWNIEGRVSMLIGKGTLNSEVDIELGDTQDAEYISNEHAVLNFSNGFWYLEDLMSLNGVGIKKAGKDYALKLTPLTPYKIDQGDIIYISKSKILVR